MTQKKSVRLNDLLHSGAESRDGGVVAGRDRSGSVRVFSSRWTEADRGAERRRPAGRPAESREPRAKIWRSKNAIRPQ